MNATNLTRRRRWAVLVLVALCAAASADDGADRFDILGFRLGMTPEEAEANFRRLNPDVELKTHNAAYRYSDGLQDFETEQFLNRLTGTIRHDRETREILQVTVEFSPPPEGGRLVQIIRNDNGIADPVTLAEYQAALIDKYGPPAGERYGLQWHFPAGRGLCSSSASGPVADNVSTMVQSSDREAILADPSRCASYLTFRTTGDPVTKVFARMVDVEHAVRAELAAGAWVAGLEAEAIERRKAQGRGPEL